MRRARLLPVLLSLSACAHHPETAASVTPRAVRLLAATVEKETSALTELRRDLEVDTDFERVPHVIATGETGLLRADGAEFTLAGDEAGTKELFIDNFILLEVLLPDGTLSGKVVVGYVDGVSQGRERIDSLGQRAFTLEPRAISLRGLVPEHGSFRLRATALDIGGVGRVSDVYVLVSAKVETPADDLR